MISAHSDTCPTTQATKWNFHEMTSVVLLKCVLVYCVLNTGEWPLFCTSPQKRAFFFK